MFCKNCGNEVKDTEKFCAKCGTPVEASVERQPVTVEAEQKPSELAQSVRKIGSGVLSKLLSGKNKIWTIVVAATLIVAILCIANAAVINNYMHRTFCSPEKYFQFVAGKEVKEFSKLAGGYYNDIGSRVKLYDFSYSGELTVEPEESFRKLAGIYLEEAGIDLAELETLKIGADLSVKDSMIRYGMTTAVNKENLLSVNTVMDLTQGEAYLQIPDLSKTYAGVSLEDYFSDTDRDKFLDQQDLIREMVEVRPKKAEVEKLVNRYLNIAAQNITNVKVGRKEKLKVGEIAQKCTELKITIDGETMQNILDAVLTEALKDKTLEEIIVRQANAAQQDGDEAYESFLKELEDAGQWDTDEILMKLIVYVDHQGNIIGCEIGEEDSQKYSIHTAQKGSNIAYEISYERYGEKVFEIFGKGKKSGDFLTGDFEVKANGKSAVDLKVKRLDMEKLKRGYINGKAELALSSDLSRELSSEIDVPMIASLVKKSDFVLEYKSSVNAVNCKVTWNYDEEKMMSIVWNYQSGSGSKASVPSGKSVLMIEDADDLKDYYEEIDWNKLLNRLEKTGALTEMAELLENNLNNLPGDVGILRYFILNQSDIQTLQAVQVVPPDYICYFMLYEVFAYPNRLKGPKVVMPSYEELGISNITMPVK